MVKWKSFLLGGVTLALIGASLGSLVVVSGIVDVSAIHAAGPQDRVLAYASTSSIRRHAPEGRNPRAEDDRALTKGLESYRTLCAPCHGGPGLEPAEFAAGLHPSPLALTSRDVQAFTDGMLFQTIYGGIGSTGMPAFGPSRSSDEIWGLVAAVRHLSALTTEEKRLLGVTINAPAGDGSGTAHLPAGHGQVHLVTITNFKFVPETVEVSEGDVVEWRNDDFVAHTATAKDHTFDTGKMDASGTGRVTFAKKGHFPYFCRFHIAMQGTVTVK